MSLLQKLEDNIEHVYGVFKHILQHQIDNFGGACAETKEVVEAIEAHIAAKKDNTPAVVAPPTVTETPAPVAETPVQGS